MGWVWTYRLRMGVRSSPRQIPQFRLIKQKRPDAHEKNLRTDPGRMHMELAIWHATQVLVKRLFQAMTKAGIFRARPRWPSQLPMGASRNWRAVFLRRPRPDSLNKSRWGRVGINQYVPFPDRRAREIPPPRPSMTRTA